MLAKELKSTFDVSDPRDHEIDFPSRLGCLRHTIPIRDFSLWRQLTYLYAPCTEISDSFLHRITMLFSLTVGKVDAGVAVLLTEDKRLVCAIHSRS